MITVCFSHIRAERAHLLAASKPIHAHLSDCFIQNNLQVRQNPVQAQEKAVKVKAHRFDLNLPDTSTKLQEVMI